MYKRFAAATLLAAGALAQDNTCPCGPGGAPITSTSTVTSYATTSTSTVTSTVTASASGGANSPFGPNGPNSPNGPGGPNGPSGAPSTVTVTVTSTASGGAGASGSGSGGSGSTATVTITAAPPGGESPNGPGSPSTVTITSTLTETSTQKSSTGGLTSAPGSGSNTITLTVTETDTITTTKTETKGFGSTMQPGSTASTPLYPTTGSGSGGFGTGTGFGTGFGTGTAAGTGVGTGVLTGTNVITSVFPTGSGSPPIGADTTATNSTSKPNFTGFPLPSNSSSTDSNGTPTGTGGGVGPVGPTGTGPSSGFLPPTESGAPFPINNGTGPVGPSGSGTGPSSGFVQPTGAPFPINNGSSPTGPTGSGSGGVAGPTGTGAPFPIGNDTTVAPTGTAVPTGYLRGTGLPLSYSHAAPNATSTRPLSATGIPSGMPTAPGGPTSPTAPFANATIPNNGTQVTNQTCFEQGGARHDNNDTAAGQNKTSDAYSCFSGPADKFPRAEEWISFDKLQDIWGDLGQNFCKNGVMNTPAQTDMVFRAIQEVSIRSLVDNRVILTQIIQETGGCVNHPDTIAPDNAYISRGLLQAYNGNVFVGNDATLEEQYASIVRMISDGVQGTIGEYGGVGMVHHLNKWGDTFTAFRAYISGFEAIDHENLSNGGPSTASYCSDIANMLTGWDGTKRSTDCQNFTGASYKR